MTAPQPAPRPRRSAPRAVAVAVALVALVAGMFLAQAPAGAANGASRVAHSFPGYCGKVKPSYGSKVGVSISRASDPWRSARHLHCARAVHVMRVYYKRAPEHGQGSGAFLRVDGYSCSTNSADGFDATSHASTCSKRHGDAISTDWPPNTRQFVYACTAEKITQLLRTQYRGRAARLVDHRCGYGWAVGLIRVSGHVRRYVFTTEDGYWDPIRVTIGDLRGWQTPREVVILSNVNALGRAMTAHPMRESYRIP